MISKQDSLSTMAHDGKTELFYPEYPVQDGYIQNKICAREKCAVKQKGALFSLNKMEDMQQKRILVFHHAENSLNGLNKHLSKAGYKVHTAFNVDEAIKNISLHRYEVAVVHGSVINNGKKRDILSIINKKLPSCRVILVATDNMNGIQQTPGFSVFFTYLNGPVDGEEICDVVESAIRRDR